MSRSNTRSRRSQWKISEDQKQNMLNLERCKNKACGEWSKRHRVCPSCGMYNGRRQVIEPAA